MKPKTKYTKELLEPIVKRSLSFAQVIEELGLRLSGGNYRNIQKWIRHHRLSTDHFTGMLWSKNRTKDDHPALAKISERMTTLSDTDIFCVNARPINTRTLHRRFIQLTGRLPRCESDDCGITDWKGRPLTMHLDHINGVNNDNRIENLQWLCPNCHQQTPTWGNSQERSIAKEFEWPINEVHQRLKQIEDAVLVGSGGLEPPKAPILSR